MAPLCSIDRPFLRILSEEDMERMLGGVRDQPADLTLDDITDCRYYIRWEKKNYEKYKAPLLEAEKLYEARKGREPPRTVYELLHILESWDQQSALDYVIPYADQERMYFEKYTSVKNKGVEGIFQIWGAFNAKTQERPLYEVKLYQPAAMGPGAKGPAAKGSFWCPCPEHKFRSAKLGIVCKHICFVVCKVGRILDPGYFDTKRLTEDQFRTLVERAEAAEGDADIPRRTDVCAEFYMYLGGVSDCNKCDVCMEHFKVPLSPDDSAVRCPHCASYFHKRCMDDVWMKDNDCCPNPSCHSIIWKDFYRP